MLKFLAGLGFAWLFITWTSASHIGSTECTLTPNENCSCTNSSGVHIDCTGAMMPHLPKMDLEGVMINTFNMEKNQLGKVRSGDFYGLTIERLILNKNNITMVDDLAFWGLEYHLDTLDLNDNRLREVPAHSLKLLRLMRSLGLAGNRITRLKSGDFATLRKLEILSLENNPITAIEPRAFKGTNLFLLLLDNVKLRRGMRGIPTWDVKSLKALSLVNNNIGVIPRDWCKGLPSLTYLGLDDNNISSIPSHVFQGIDNTLITLEINGNKLQRIPKHALRLLQRLESLELRRNRITKIHARSFNASSSLTFLDLSSNIISVISPYAFEGLDSLEELDLRFNTITTLDQDAFINLPSAREGLALLSDNAWSCDCHVAWLRHDHYKTENETRYVRDAGLLRCATPDHLSGKLLAKLPSYDLKCEEDEDYYYYYEYYDDVST